MTPSPTTTRQPVRRPLLAGLLTLPTAVGLLLAPGSVGAQARETGPVIREHGAVFRVGDLDVPVETDRAYRVVFDIYDAPESTSEVNPAVNTPARFLNMHAHAGVPAARMELALVLHGPASRATLSHRAYRERYGVDNPDLPVLEALADAGARIYLCGQSAASRGLLPEEKLAGPVELALSAMTMLVTLQDDGYELIAF